MGRGSQKWLVGLKFERATSAHRQEGQPVGSAANVRTKNPGGVNRRSEISPVSTVFLAMVDGLLEPWLWTIKSDACSGLSPVQCSIEAEGLSQSPGSEGRVWRPVRTNVLSRPPTKAAQRFCKSI